MKKLLFILLVFGTFSCFPVGDALTPSECYNSVEAEYPDALHIYHLDGANYKFIVIDSDSTIYYIETMNLTDSNISKKRIIHRW